MAPGLGADFTKLWFASAVSNIGDGLTLAAGPLLLASLTDDPALVAGAVFAQQLPWLLFSLLSGVIVDRLDRRKLAVGANLARGVIVTALVTLAVFGVHAVVWNVITHSVRQREVPDELRGRVGSAFFLLSTGGSALGALVGGVLARQFGITAPFWSGLVVVAGVAVAAAAGLHRPAATT
ncbi:MFS transporter [Saccharothrix deserti]|uniref:MFS transporter n=1 Tax=Saccharothrix deserti TaxID=2593674 RepID=UPI00131E6F05|nr:MFS transporter [Saccharothrix deserti]